MGQQASFVEESRERVQAAFQSVEDEFEKLQNRLEKRRKEFDKRRNDFNKRAEKRIKKLRQEMRKYEVVKRAETLADDVGKEFEKRSKSFEKRFESGVESVLGLFQIASRSEVEKLDKKLDRISRRLAALDKTVHAEEREAEVAE